jgi:hypothetical protein
MFPRESSSSFLFSLQSQCNLPSTTNHIGVEPGFELNDSLLLNPYSFVSWRIWNDDRGFGLYQLCSLMKGRDGYFCIYYNLNLFFWTLLSIFYCSDTLQIKDQALMQWPIISSPLITKRGNERKVGKNAYYLIGLGLILIRTLCGDLRPTPDLKRRWCMWSAGSS